MPGKPYNDARFTKRPWTKEEVHRLILSWNAEVDKAPEQFEEEFQRPFSAIQFVVTAIRKNGKTMRKRSGKGHYAWGVSAIIREVLAENNASTPA